MNVFYITLIGFLGALAGWLWREVGDYKKALIEAKGEIQALGQGMDELGQMNSDQDLTITELLVRATEREAILKARDEQIESLTKHVVELEEKEINFDHELRIKRNMINNLSSQRDIANRRVAEQGRRIADLEMITVFHANNCLPSLVDPSRT